MLRLMFKYNILNIEIFNDLNNWNDTLKMKLKLQLGGGNYWFYHWIIHSIDSFERLIHSGTEHMTVFMSG